MSDLVRRMRTIRRRHHIPEFLKENNLNGIVCEIGVYRGDFLKHLLRTAKNTIYAIDPWLASSDPSVTGGKETQAEMDGMYQSVLAWTLKYPMDPMLNVWRMTSRDAAKCFLDGGVDFAYIDANHSFAAVQEDIGLWWPKIRPGGILAGHDYVTHQSIGFDFGVVKAVDSFVAANCLRDQLAIIDRRFPSWMIQKPKKEDGHGN